MNNSGANGLKIAVIFMLFAGFMFVLVEQRLESKEYDIRIREIQKNIEIYNSQKMELSIRIDGELQRLSSYDYSSLGKPITMKDVIVVPVSELTEESAGTPAENAAPNILDSLIHRLINLY